LDSTFTAALPHPFYGDHVLYHAYHFGDAPPSLRAWQFNGWPAETMSWKTGCYIHAGLSLPIWSIKGPEAKDYLQSIVINSLEKFPVGSMKHAVELNDAGLIVCHGIIERKADHEFESFAGGPPGPQADVDNLPFDVKVTRKPIYLFQIAGPKSLDLLEKVTGESLRDIGFLRFRDSSINGTPTEVGRIGMSGNLAYELHGPFDEGSAIYDAVYQAGQEFGIERLGWGSYLVNHVEGGFPQMTWTFVGAVDPALWPVMKNFWQVSGSADPDDMRARTRTPVEVRWHNMARFDHEYPGRAALEAEMAEPKRTTVTLRWNPDDVLDLQASLFRQGEVYKPLDLPYAPQRWPMAHADHVEHRGRPVGWSSGTIYSYYFREVLSLGCLDLAVTDIGTEVTVLWGDYRGPIKEIRATVEHFPYLTESRNRDLDVAALPRS
jgi:glycine cleavage system aminomethyltransferase T